MGNLEDEDGNRDNNEGREGKGGTTTTPSTARKVLSLVPMLVKIWDSLMGKCLAQHLELQMESHLEFMKELSWVLQMAPLMVLMNLCLALMKASYLFS